MASPKPGGTPEHVPQRDDGRHHGDDVHEALIAVSVRQHELLEEAEQQRRKAEALAAELRASQERLAADFADMAVLRDLATQLVTADSDRTIHEAVLSAAIAIMKADAGTVQAYEPETNSLVLLAARGFEPEMTRYYHRVDADSGAACGLALQTGRRVFIEFDDESNDDGIRHVAAGYRTAQAMPLVSRSGARLGMLNTHWRQAGHRPDERQLHFLDLLARQAAELVERRQMEKTLRESETRFRRFADIAPAILWVTEPDGSCSFLSRGWYETSGQTEADALGFGWLEAVHPEDRDACSRVFREANEQQKPFSMDYRLRQADGAYRWAIDAGRPRVDGDGRFLGHIGSVIDCHERKLAEEALRAADRRKSEFLAVLAHELRNPLAPMRFALELLHRSDDGTGGETSRVRGVLDRQLSHVVRLVDDLLDVSRITRGKIELRKDRIDVATLIAGAVELARPAIAAARQTLTVAAPDEHVALEGDAVRLTQVVVNLLNNASKFTPAGGHVWLIAETVGEDPGKRDRLRIRVRDTGIGITNDLLPKVFDMFTQGDATVERSQSGLGIGLTLVQNLVARHGGTVEVHSAGVGQGSEFTVCLPLDPALQAARAAVDQPTELPCTRSLRILVADDNQDGREMLTYLLAAEGHVVAEAADGSAAVETARAFKPEVAILDIGMPGVSGYAVAEALRQQLDDSSLVLIALSGLSQPEDKARAVQAGFDCHFTKPVDVHVLRAYLAGLGPERL